MTWAEFVEYWAKYIGRVSVEDEGAFRRNATQALHNAKEGKKQVLIPEYPGGIKPGKYDTVTLLRQHKDNPEAIAFIADMLE